MRYVLLGHPYVSLTITVQVADYYIVRSHNLTSINDQTSSVIRLEIEQGFRVLSRKLLTEVSRAYN